MSPALGGLLRLDVAQFHTTPNEDHLAARLIQQLEHVPAGARVELIVAPRQIVPWSIHEVMRSPAWSVTVVCSDADTITAWNGAIRAGDRWTALEQVV